MSMTFDTKIAVVLREDLPTWQKLNVTAFLVSGIAGTTEDVVGEPYEDGSGNRYLPMFKQPVMVFGATGDQIQAAYDRAMAEGAAISIFTEDLFATGNDIDNRAAVKARPREELRVVGFALRDRKKRVDRILNGIRLHQ
jgi:hypothetical protein